MESASAPRSRRRGSATWHRRWSPRIGQPSRLDRNVVRACSRPRRHSRRQLLQQCRVAVNGQPGLLARQVGRQVPDIGPGAGGKVEHAAADRRAGAASASARVSGTDRAATSAGSRRANQLERESTNGSRVPEPQSFYSRPRPRSAAGRGHAAHPRQAARRGAGSPSTCESASASAASSPGGTNNPASSPTRSAMRAGRGADDRQPPRQGFGNRHPVGLMEGGQHEQIGRVVDGIQSCGIALPNQRHLIGQTVFAQSGPQPLHGRRDGARGFPHRSGASFDAAPWPAHETESRGPCRGWASPHRAAASALPGAASQRRTILCPARRPRSIPPGHRSVAKRATVDRRSRPQTPRPRVRAARWPSSWRRCPDRGRSRRPAADGSARRCAGVRLRARFRPAERQAPDRRRERSRRRRMAASTQAACSRAAGVGKGKLSSSSCTTTDQPRSRSPAMMRRSEP